MSKIKKYEVVSHSGNNRKTRRLIPGKSARQVTKSVERGGECVVSIKRFQGGCNRDYPIYGEKSIYESSITGMRC